MDFEERVYRVMVSGRLGFAVRALSQVGSERRHVSRRYVTETLPNTKLNDEGLDCT
jgi:hypothetical protein